MKFRKLILSGLFSLIALSGYSQIDFGTNIRILTNLPIDTRMVVTNILSRDSLNPLFRYEGLTVYVKSTLTNYQLRGGISNSDWLPITGGNISHWDSAYIWGNHAGLYKPITYVPGWSEITNTPFNISSPLNNQLLKFDSGTGFWENWTPSFQTNISATAPLNYISTSGVLSISQAGASTNGYLSSTDWNLFNNKSSFSLPSLKSGSILFSNGTTITGDSINFFWDNSNKRLGIGTNAPAASLSVGSSSQFQIDSSGNILKINNVTTSFPSTQGPANSFLSNDGSGNLSWTSNYSGGSGSNTITTPEGGYAVYMYNGSGNAISQYMVVMADPNNDTSIAIAPSRCNLPIGITYDSIPNGSWGWIVVGGITYVQIYTSVTRSYYAYVSSSADGQVESDNNPGNSNSQRAVGHFLESVNIPNSYMSHGHHGHHGYHGHHGQHGSNTAHATAMIIVHF